MARKINGRNVERGIYETNGYVYVRLFPNGIEHKEYIGPTAEPGVLDAAHEKLHEMRKAIRAGKLGQQVKEVRWNVSKACDGYWEEEGKKKPSAPTIRTFIAYFKEHFGEEYVDAVNFTHTIALREGLEKQGLKLNSINRYHQAWRRIFYFLVEMKRVKAKGYENLKLPEFNPGTPIKSRAETHLGSEKHLRRRRVVTPSEFETFLKFTTDRVKKVCYLAVQTTLRRNDLFKAIKAKSATGQGLQSKTQREYDVPLPEGAEQLIGEGVDLTNFRAEFEEARAASGLPHFQFRDLRKSLPSILREGNYDIKKISEILGHSSVAMTEIYLPVPDAPKREAMQKAGSFFELPADAVAVNQ